MERSASLSPRRGGGISRRSCAISSRTLSRLRHVAVIGNTHFRDAVQGLAETYAEIVPLAFEFDGRRRPTYAGRPGVAETSEGLYLAAKHGLGPRDFKRLAREWAKRGILHE